MSLETRDERLRTAVTTAVRGAKTKPGETMNNTGIIIAQSLIGSPNEYSDEFVVLALVPEGFQPFVVWTRYIGVGQNADGRTFHNIDYCVQGDYHRSIDDALEVYNALVEKKAFGGE